MSTVSSAWSSVNEALTQRLQILRSRVIRCLLVAGAARVASLFIGICVADFAIDWLFQLDRPQRIIALGLAIIALAWFVIRWMARPLYDIPGDDALCLAVESRNDELGESVISALQFSREKELASKGVSLQLVQAAVDQGVQRAREIDFNDVIDKKLSTRYLSILVVASLILLGGIIGIASGSPLLSIWYQRNILLADVNWPQDTYLIIVGAEDDTIILPRGDDWTLVVKVDPTSERKELSEVKIEIDNASDRFSKPMRRITGQHFEYPFKQIDEEFRFRVSSGRSRTNWVTLKLVDRPRVENLALTYTPPAYSGEPTRLLDPEAGPYRLLEGGALQVKGISNQSLSEATLTRDGEVTPMKIEGKNFSLDIAPDQLTDGSYRIALTDTGTPEPLESTERSGFSILIQIDRSPRVNADITGVTTMVTAQALVPLEGSARDDYMINDLYLSYEWLPIEVTEDGETLGAITKGKHYFDSHKTRMPTSSIAIREILDMTQFNLPTPAIFRFSFEAVDNKEDSNGNSAPNRGRSVETTLRVVSPAELRTDLLRREKEIRQDVLRHRNEQSMMAIEVLAIQAELSPSDTEERDTEERKASISPALNSSLVDTHRNEQLLAGNLDVVASRLRDIVTEIRNNRLEEEGGALQAKLLDDIIAPLRFLIAESIPDVSKKIERVRRLGDDPTPRDEALAEVVTSQREILAVLDLVLDAMEKVEGYQEALNLYHLIMDRQQEVYERTVEERRRRQAERIEQERLERERLEEEQNTNPGEEETSEGEGEGADNSTEEASPQEEEDNSAEEPSRSPAESPANSP